MSAVSSTGMRCASRAVDRAVADDVLAGDTTLIAVSLWVALRGS
ncbi:hypothetical protein NKH77_41330 [Streptomyces sp. M19]